MFIEMIFTIFVFFSSSSSLHLQLSIRCEVYLMLLVVTYHCEFAWSRLTSEVRSKVRLISFKPSWAPLWQGCGATTDTISPYSVVEREKKAPIAHHMPDRPGTHRLPPLPLLFLVFSTLCVSYCLSLPFSPPNPLLTSFSSLSSCHLPSPPTQQSAVHSSSKITPEPGQPDTSFISSYSACSL